MAPPPLAAAVSLGAAQDRAQSRACALRSAAQGKKTFLGYTLCPGTCLGSGAGNGAGTGPNDLLLQQPWGGLVGSGSGCPQPAQGG